jgi:hypothetical protein
MGLFQWLFGTKSQEQQADEEFQRRLEALAPEPAPVQKVEPAPPGEDLPHTHVAIDDAAEQAALFTRMLREFMA